MFALGLSALCLSVVLLGYVAFRFFRERRRMSGIWRAESTAATFPGSPYGLLAPPPIGPPPPLHWPLYEPKRGDTVYAPGEVYRMAVWCEAEDPTMVYCVPLIPNNKTGEDEGKLLWRKFPKRSLTFYKRDVTFTYYS